MASIKTCSHCGSEDHTIKRCSEAEYVKPVKRKPLVMSEFVAVKDWQKNQPHVTSSAVAAILGFDLREVNAAFGAVTYEGYGVWRKRKVFD